MSKRSAAEEEIYASERERRHIATSLARLASTHSNSNGSNSLPNNPVPSSSASSGRFAYPPPPPRPGAPPLDPRHAERENILISALTQQYHAHAQHAAQQQLLASAAGSYVANNYGLNNFSPAAVVASDLPPGHAVQQQVQQQHHQQQQQAVHVQHVIRAHHPASALPPGHAGQQQHHQPQQQQQAMQHVIRTQHHVGHSGQHGIPLNAGHYLPSSARGAHTQTRNVAQSPAGSYEEQQLRMRGLAAGTSGMEYTLPQQQTMPHRSLPVHHHDKPPNPSNKIMSAVQSQHEQQQILIANLLRKPPPPHQAPMIHYHVSAGNSGSNTPFVDHMLAARAETEADAQAELATLPPPSMPQNHILADRATAEAEAAERATLPPPSMPKNRLLAARAKAAAEAAGHASLPPPLMPQNPSPMPQNSSRDLQSPSILPQNTSHGIGNRNVQQNMRMIHSSVGYAHNGLARANHQIIDPGSLTYGMDPYGMDNRNVQQQTTGMLNPSIEFSRGLSSGATNHHQLGIDSQLLARMNVPSQSRPKPANTSSTPQPPNNDSIGRLNVPIQSRPSSNPRPLFDGVPERQDLPTPVPTPVSAIAKDIYNIAMANKCANLSSTKDGANIMANGKKVDKGRSVLPYKPTLPNILPTKKSPPETNPSSDTMNKSIQQIKPQSGGESSAIMDHDKPESIKKEGKKKKKSKKDGKKKSKKDGKKKSKKDGKQKSKRNSKGKAETKKNEVGKMELIEKEVDSAKDSKRSGEFNEERQPPTLHILESESKPRQVEAQQPNQEKVVKEESSVCMEAQPNQETFSKEESSVCMEAQPNQEKVAKVESGVTLQCPKCKKDFFFPKRTAKACLTNHTKTCGSPKRRKTKNVEKKPHRPFVEREGRRQLNRRKRRRDDSVLTPDPADESGNNVRSTRVSRKGRKQSESSPTEEGASEEAPVKKKKKPTSSSADTKHSNKYNGVKGLKKSRSSFIFFAAELRPKVAQEFPKYTVPKLGVIMGERWRALTSDEKKPYDDMAIEDRERYHREKAEYDEKNASGQETRDEEEGVEENKPSAKKNTKARSHLCKVESMSQPPYAPMGQLWLDKSLRSSRAQSNDSVMSVDLNAGGTLIGRRWVWDEGYFVDEHFDPQARDRGQNSGEVSLTKGRCTCGSNHLYTLLKSITSTKSINNNGKSPGRARRSERSASTYSASVTELLASRQLDPHTLVSCEEYEMGSEFRFAKDVQTESVQPFSVRVNPDATFLADLHAHLCDSEIIGLLGGYYSSEEKCIYIQAAFPCRATDRADSGQTDVEMDPVGQIYATEAITNHGMSVVGWYHSHPDFQPNPSITDIDNQASYQQLFQGNLASGNSTADIVPFVGLIVGTYDAKNPTSQSVMRWFHVRLKDTAEGRSVNFPMNLKMTHRHYRKMTFKDQRIAGNIRGSMTVRGSSIRQVLESRYLSCPVSGVNDSETKDAIKASAGRQRIQTVSISEHEGSLSRDTELVVAQSEKSKSSQTDNLMNADVHSKAHPNKKKNTANGECSLSLIETGKSPLLLSETLFDQTPKSNRMWKFESARPLYFNENERSILEMKQDTIPYDVVAGIIWFAIEREQQMLQSDANENLLISPGVPASSRSILELLLRQSSTPSSALDERLYYIIHCLDDTETTTLRDKFDDNDASIFHNLDVVLGHYAPKLNRINPFTSWNGAGDKGNISKDCNGDSGPWVDFYLTKILKMKAVQTDEGQVYRGGIKMKRGHKITASLLTWARNMQLGSVDNDSDERASFPFDNSLGKGLNFDHEQSLCVETKAADTTYPPQHEQYIYVVSEVMRLMAARWRECGAKASGAPRRRTQRSTSSRSSSGQNSGN